MTDPVAVTPLLRAEGLSKTFAGRDGLLRAVDHVSFTLEEGKSLGVVGESGSGKSTLARLVLRLIEPTAGSLSSRDVDLLALRGSELRRQRRRMQMVFQNPYGSLLPGLTVAQNIAEPLRIHRIGSAASRRARGLELLGLVGLNARYASAYPRQLSGGQQQRVGIARALALEPELLICDEPTSALDVSIQAQILTLFADLQTMLGFSMIFITHNLAVAQRLTDQIMVMRDGRVVEAGDTASIFADAQHPYTRELLDSVLPVRGSPSQRPASTRGAARDSGSTAGAVAGVLPGSSRARSSIG